jgi:cellobiose phosphorylase
MYRLIIESLLGVNLEIDRLRIAPRPPAEWKKFQIHYRHRETFYHITIHNNGQGGPANRLILDGSELSEDFITLVDDGQSHEVDVEVHV